MTDRSSRWPFPLAAGLLVALAGGLFAVSFVDYQFLKDYADSISGSGNAEMVTPELHAELVQRTRVFSGLLLAVIALLYPLRQRLNAIPNRWSESSRSLKSATRRHLGGLRSEPSAVLITAVVLIMVGIGLRLAFLWQPIRFDEGRTFLSFASMPIHYIPLRYNQPNNHILNTILIKLTTSVFGDSVAAIRLPAFTFGVLGLPAAFFAFRRAIGTGVALLALGLIATSSPLIEYSTNGRGYTLVMLAFFGMLILGPYAWRQRSFAAWGLIALLGAAGAFCNPVMMLPAATFFLWILVQILLDREGRPKAVHVADLITAGLAMAALTLLVYAPTIAVNGAKSLVANEGIEKESLGSVFAGAPHFLGGLVAVWNRDYPAFGIVLLVTCLAVGVLLHHKIARITAPLHLCVVAVTLAYMLVISDFGWLRVWLFIVPVYLALTATGIFAVLQLSTKLAGLRGPHAAVKVSAVSALVIAGLVGVSVLTKRTILSSPETGVFPAAKAAIELFEKEAEPGDLFGVFATNATQLQYYAQRQGIPIRPIGDWQNARWFRRETESGMESEPAKLRGFVIVNRVEGDRVTAGEEWKLIEEDYMIDRLPPHLRLEGDPVELFASDELEVFAISLAAR